MPNYGTSQTTDVLTRPLPAPRRGAAPHVPPARVKGGHARPLGRPRPMPRGK